MSEEQLQISYHDQIRTNAAAATGKAKCAANLDSAGISAEEK
jgi:hypothetical protein